MISKYNLGKIPVEASIVNTIAGLHFTALLKNECLHRHYSKFLLLLLTSISRNTFKRLFSYLVVSATKGQRYLLNKYFSNKVYLLPKCISVLNSFRSFTKASLQKLSLEICQT